MDLSPAPLPILLASRGWLHPHLLARAAFRRILAGLPGVNLVRLPGLRGFSRRDLAAYRAVVLYLHEKAADPADLSALRAYVAGGGGLVAVHSAAASYKRQAEFADLLGGRFDRHGQVGRFSVRPAAGAPLPGAPTAPFALVDERYLHWLTAPVTVDYVSIAEGDPEPFAWRRDFGSGRVFYLAAGHTAAGISHPSIQSILAAGLRWAAKDTP